MKRLLSQGVIRLTTGVDPSRVGYRTEAINTAQVDLNRLEGVARRLASLPEVQSMATVITIPAAGLRGLCLLNCTACYAIMEKVASISSSHSSSHLKDARFHPTHMLAGGKRLAPTDMQISPSLAAANVTN